MNKLIRGLTPASLHECSKDDTTGRVIKLTEEQKNLSGSVYHDSMTKLFLVDMWTRAYRHRISQRPEAQ